jgi:hypothetical protein
LERAQLGNAIISPVTQPWANGQYVEAVTLKNRKRSSGENEERRETERGKKKGPNLRHPMENGIR